jgi:hypothetical protein
MTIKPDIILVSIIFLILVWFITRLTANHKFRSIIFIGLYLAAVSPNLANLFSPFSFDKVVMAWFDSIYIYIIFSIYLGTVLVLFWLKDRSPKTYIQVKTPVQHISEEAIGLVTSTVGRDLKSTFGDDFPYTEITNRDLELMRHGKVSPQIIMNDHNQCLSEARQKQNNEANEYIGCRVSALTQKDRHRNNI